MYWNEFYGRYDTYDFGFGHEAFLEKNCAVSNCFATKVSKVSLSGECFNIYVPKYVAHELNWYVVSGLFDFCEWHSPHSLGNEPNE